MPTWGKAITGVGDFSGTDPDKVPNMYDEANLGIPPKGPYLCEVISLKAGETGENSKEPGSPKIVLGVSIAEPKGTKKARYNGYAMWRHMPVSEAFAGRINGLIQALLHNSKAFQGDSAAAAKKRAAIVKAFWDGKVVLEGDVKEGQTKIEKIGTWNIPDEMLLGINARTGKDRDGEPILEIGSAMPFTDAPKGQPAEEEDAELEEDEDEEEVEDEEAADEDAEVAEREEELRGYSLAKLKTTAKSLELTVPRGAKEDALIELILDAEFPPVDDEEEAEEEEPEEEEEEEEEEDEDEEPDEEEEGDEFDEMDRAELKKALKANGVELRVTTKTTDDEIREALRAAGDPEDEEEPEEDEEEPEPPAKPARRGAKATAASPARPAANRRKGKKGEPPF